MKYFSWLYMDRLEKGKKQEEKEVFRLDLAIFVSIICVIGIVVLWSVISTLGQKSYENRMKLSEEGYQQYVSSFQKLDEDFRVAFRDKSVVQLKTEKPNLIVSIYTKGENTIVVAEDGEISLRYLYHEDTNDALELQTKLMSHAEYEETTKMELDRLRIGMGFFYVLMVGTILLVIASIASIIEHLIHQSKKKKGAH